MSAASSASQPKTDPRESTDQPPETGLTPFEERMVRFFIDLAQGFSLPKSVGEIFGLVFASPEPVPFDAIVARLGISAGSASTGLKFLQRMGALRTVYVANDRRSFFEPEMSLRRLLDGLLNEKLMPHLRQSSTHLEELDDLLPEKDSPDHAVLAHRLSHLENWRRKASTLLPLIGRFLGQKRVK